MSLLLKKNDKIRKNSGFLHQKAVLQRPNAKKAVLWQRHKKSLWPKKSVPNQEQIIGTYLQKTKKLQKSHHPAVMWFQTKNGLIYPIRPESSDFFGNRYVKQPLKSADL